MNIHPRLMDGKLILLGPNDKIQITITDKNPYHVQLITSTVERERKNIICNPMFPE